jgi:hypothetical protein
MSLTFYSNDPCPKCNRPILHAVIDPHPTSRDLAFHKFHCADCGPIRTEILSLGRRTQPDAAAIAP